MLIAAAAVVLILPPLKVRHHWGMAFEEHLTMNVADTTFSGVYTRPEKTAATVVLAHGAGAGMNHPFLVGFSEAMNELGFATLRFNFPYMEQGRRFPDRPPKAIAAWRQVVQEAEGRSSGEPVWACGKSFGGRMASMAVAEGMPAAGLVFLGYPLHPPGKPESIRDAHLYDIHVPLLFVQGSNDSFARPDLLDGVIDKLGEQVTLHSVRNADHSFAVKGVKRSQDQIGASLAPVVAAFITG